MIVIQVASQLVQTRRHKSTAVYESKLDFFDHWLPIFIRDTRMLDWNRHIETDVLFFVLRDDSDVVFVEPLAELLDK